MRKYLKLFETHADYTAFTQTEDFILPNVSHCIAQNDVHYNPIRSIDFNGHDYVDLGLPSGNLWATMNVGATSVDDYGFFFSWGETVGYSEEEVLAASPEKLFSSDYWNTNGQFDHYLEEESTLSLEDDGVRVNMGGDWVMPNNVDFQELIDNTTPSYDETNGIFTFTATNGNSISFVKGGTARKKYQVLENEIISDQSVHLKVSNTVYGSRLEIYSGYLFSIYKNSSSEIIGEVTPDPYRFSLYQGNPLRGVIKQ